jgi:RNA polymerase sigma-70 factor (ECF subfamily)
MSTETTKYMTTPVGNPPNSAKDVELLRLVAGGNEGAFVELYQLYSRPVYNYLLRLVYERTAAEDLLQEVFWAVWQGAHRFRGDAKVKSWIYRIAHNQAVSWLRKNHSTAPLTEWEESESETIPEIAVEDRLQTVRIRHALTCLSPKHREVVELAFIHEMSYAEIAQIIGCPVGTVKSRMSYALRALNVHMNTRI